MKRGPRPFPELQTAVRAPRKACADGSARSKLILGMRRSISRRATLDRQLSQIFLARLEVRGVLSRGALSIHSEPDGPNDEADDAGRDVLRTLHSFFVGELLGLLVISDDLSPIIALGIDVLLLDRRDRLGVPSIPRCLGEGGGYGPQCPDAHNNIPPSEKSPSAN